jgi:hypothetical protein
MLAIIPLSFSQVLFSYRFSEKSSKIKFLEKLQKNLFKFLYQKWGREAPGRPQGDLHATSPPSLNPGLSLISSSLVLSLSQKQ